jgi:hypothetical protein
MIMPVLEVEGVLAFFSVKTNTAGNTTKVSATLQMTQSPMNNPNVFTG